MTQQTNWWPGLIALAISLLCGAAYMLLQRGKGGGKAASPEPQRDGVLDDLDRRAQSLIEQLKELVADKHSLAPEQFEAEKSRLEREAAAALRARDEYLNQRKPGTSGAPGSSAPAHGQAAPAPTGFAARNPQMVGALWGAGVVLFFGALGYLLVSNQQTRTDGMEATGKVPSAQGGMGQQQQQQMPSEDEELTAAKERLAANPNDLEASAFVGHEMIRTRELEQAEKITNKALAVDPFHVESRVHLGVLHALRGDLQAAEAELLELADTYPGAQEALLFLGFINLQSGNRNKALDYFERFTVEVPRNQQPPGLDAAIAQLRQEAGR
ncbi:tetratricopeptide repeat protein [Hyalangium versicolor]|uniref:tetratricopeptide repeat protein n=1 Tax=Hyalangium versicolor TaxID=2861190 RepID=UPI001CCBC16E|nr:tetratricopeptide repeat protein [Hyalangium versicolor]